jgi:protein arginine kinase activator
VKCERCQRREAAVKYIEVEEGVKRSRWLCEACAAEEGAQLLPGDAESAAGLQVFLGGESEPEAPPCPTCGAELQQLHDHGLLGCTACYDHFREQLLPLVRRYHGATVHLGKAPGARGPRAALRLELRQRRQDLEAAVAAEDYEEAARLRDEIAGMQDELSATEDGEPGP